MPDATSASATSRLTSEAAGARVAALYERHGRAVYGVCRMLLRDPHDAEDAVQSTFLAAHRALVNGSAPRDADPWLFAIARNECRAGIRARMRAPATEHDDALEALPAPEADPSEQSGDPAVRKALAALPARQREAVVLHDVLGLRAREVGRVLGMSLPAVEALLFRARRQLRVRLQPVGRALALPVGLRDTLAASIQGFGDAGQTGAAAAGGAAAGLIAKLAAAPTAAKVAAGTVAVTAAGTATVADLERGVPPSRPAATITHSSDDSAARLWSREADEDAWSSSGRSEVGGDDRREVRSGPPTERGGGEREDAERLDRQDRSGGDHTDGADDGDSSGSGDSERSEATDDASPISSLSDDDAAAGGRSGSGSSGSSGSSGASGSGEPDDDRGLPDEAQLGTSSSGSDSDAGASGSSGSGSDAESSGSSESGGDSSGSGGDPSGSGGDD